ncbi:MAG: ATP-binding protein [Candidatus Hodarchaeales archaeon]|jgi:DNA helicase HerA-like ATPase
MQITKATTSHINFRKERDEFQIREQDFIIIHDEHDRQKKNILAKITSLSQEKSNELKGEAKILGEYEDNTFRLSPCRIPVSIGAEVNIPPKGLISKIISYKEDQGIYLGDVVTSPNNADPYLLSPRFFERHVLCVASTGAGKSYSIGVLIEEIILNFKEASVLLFDLHNEYWGLTQKNVGMETKYLSADGYHPRGFEEQILVFEKDSLGLGSKFDLPRLRRLLGLTSAQENALSNMIEEPADLEVIKTLIQESDIHTATKDNLILKVNSLLKESSFALNLDVSSLIKKGQVSIIRLDQYTDEKRRNMVVNELLTQIFSLKTQNKIESSQEIIVIVEEAHRYAYKSRILARIAREGRKFGLYEILVSQRPGDLPDNIIANMNTLVALRIKSEKDVTKIRLMEGIENETVSILPHLLKGEAMLVGLQDDISFPVKVKIRPRLTKHVDPQIDRMPDSVRIYEQKSSIDPTETEIVSQNTDLQNIDNEKLSKVVEISKPFDKKDLANLLSCEHIMILHKNTGICIFQLSVSMLKIDPQLVSGFLTAITSLFTELKDDLVKDRTIIREFTEEIGDRSFTIIAVEGEHSVTALILDRPPKFKNRFKKRIREFNYTFEEKFNKNLVSFVGELDPFQSALRIIDKYLGFSLIGPLRLNTNLDTDVKEQLIYQIISDQIEQLAPSEGVFLEELVNICLLNSDYNYIETINAIVELFHSGILNLHDPIRIMPIIEKMKIQGVKSDKFRISKDDDFTEVKVGQVNGSLHEHLTEERISIFQQLIQQITDSNIPTQLKEDILVRNVQFESGIKVKNNSIQALVYTEENLMQSLNKFFEAGFIIDKKNKNPLNGLNIILTLANDRIMISLAKYEHNTYILVIARIF